MVDAQAALRSLTEAIVFDGSGRVLARTGLSFTMEVEQIPADALEQAFAGEVVELTSDTEDRVRALVRLDGFGDAYLFVGRFVDAKVLGFMERTQTMVAEYQRMQRERSGIQITSALIFMIVALLLLFASVWIGLALANQLVAPISRLITAADRVRSGDLLARVPEEGPDTDEFVLLSRAFNRMTAQLDGQRRELIQANQQLDERSRFTETVLAGVSAGVIGTDAGRRIVLPNRAAQDLLDEADRGLAGRADRRGPAGRRRNCWTRPTCTPTRWSSASSPCFAASASAPSWCGWSPQRDDGRTLGLHRHLRRHHRAAVGAAAGGLGRGGAADRARGQEPADPDPAVGRAAGAQILGPDPARGASPSPPRSPPSSARSTPSAG